MSDRNHTTTLRCRLLGHKFTEVKDYTQGKPGYYIPVRHCRRCHYQEGMIEKHVRDDAKWAAHKIDEWLEEHRWDGEP